MVSASAQSSGQMVRSQWVEKTKQQCPFSFCAPASGQTKGLSTGNHRDCMTNAKLASQVKGDWKRCTAQLSGCWDDKVVLGLLTAPRRQAGTTWRRKEGRKESGGEGGSLSLQKAAQLASGVNLSFFPLCFLEPLPTCQPHFSRFRAVFPLGRKGSGYHLLQRVMAGFSTSRW